MRLNINAFRMIKPSAKVIIKKPISDCCDDIEPCSLSTIEKITNTLMLNGQMRVLDVVELTGLTQSVVYRAFRLMREKSDLIAVPGPNDNMKNGYYNLTGSKALISSIKLKGAHNPLSGRTIQSNNTSGINGVSFITASNRFITTFGRGNVWTFNNLLDAACKRKSLDSKLVT